ncbi:MAG: DUF3530 family protein [Oleibacter sp.]|nr:DUF3530 family protein [Thalassolituus sp.]
MACQFLTQILKQQLGVSLLICVSLFIFTSARVWAADEVAEPSAANEPAATEEPMSENAETIKSETTAVENKALRALPFTDASRHQDILSYLTQQQRRDEIRTLLVDQTQFYGLYLPQRTAKAQGGALLLHDLEQHGHWPTVIAPLREFLPDQGWSTMAIQMPEPYRGVAAPKTTSSSTPTPMTEAEPSPDASLPVQDATGLISPDSYGKKVVDRILAATTYLNERGQLNLMVFAHGDTAIWAINALLNRQRDNGDAKGIYLILLDAREHPASQLYLADQLSQLDIPVFDLISANNQQNAFEWEKRLGRMKREKHLNYQQLVLQDSYTDEPRIRRRIWGWLKTHAAGTELPRSGN